MRMTKLDRAEATFKTAAEQFVAADVRPAEQAAFQKLLGTPAFTPGKASEAMQTAFNAWRDLDPDLKRQGALLEWCSQQRPALYQWLLRESEH